MSDEIYGTLRHCLMAGMCSAAEPTGELGHPNTKYESERDRLNKAKWRCPYSPNARPQYVKMHDDSSYSNYKQVELHCERDWIQENA